MSSKKFSIINNIYEADKCVAASICDSAYYVALLLDGAIFFTRHLPAQEIGVQEALQYKISAKKRVFAASLHTEFFQRTDVPFQFIKLSFFRSLECGERA